MFKNKLSVAATVVVATVLGFASMASASTPSAALGAGAESLSDSLIAIAVVVLPLAAGIAAIPLGWRWVRKFIK